MRGLHLKARSGLSHGTVADGVGGRLVAAVLGLSLAGVAAPIAVSAMAATAGLPGSPLLASALAALLVLAPTGVGLTAVLSGLRPLAAALAARGDGEAEHAVLRVLVDALIFFYALGLAGLSPDKGSAALAVAACGLVGAWALLLYAILWPVASPFRRLCGVALDVALFSAFLHFGGAAAAGWYPLYLLATLYAGFRFGLGALAATATLSIIGFAAVILSTEIWQRQPLLAGGLILGLAVLPGFAGGPIRRARSARGERARADADGRRLLRLIADNLRAPSALEQTIPAVVGPIGDVIDFAALNAGSFAAPVEAFLLRDLVKRALTPLLVDAAAAGILLRWRIDPQLPGCLRGRARAFSRLLAVLTRHALATRDEGAVRIALDAAAADARRLRLRVIAETTGGEREPNVTPEAPAGDDPLALLLVRRLVALLGGAFTVEPAAGGRTRLVATLSLVIEEGAADLILDLAGRTVFLASEEEAFASALGEMLAAWQGAPRWLGDCEAALAALSRCATTESPILIVDGRRNLLSSLSLAHRAAGLGPAVPFVLLIADARQIESLGAVDEGEIDGFIPAPPTRQLLANALAALPLEPIAPNRPETLPVADPPSPMAEPLEAATRQISQRITPIASHPKFLPEAAVLDRRAIDGLRALGGDPAFLGEVIETFEADARQIMARLDKAVADADAALFAQSLNALRRAASPLGATQLCEFLASLQDLSAAELNQRGGMHLQRLDAELGRFAAALTEVLSATEARFS